MTQELKKEEASTNFVLTEIRDQFSKIKILSSKLNLSQDSISYIFTWLNELKYWIEERDILPEDIKTTISISSNFENMTVKHEFNFVKSFDPVISFCKKIKKDFDLNHFDECQQMILNFRPLSVVFFIKIGTVFDCGIGIDKPMDNKELSQVLSFSSESLNILSWSESLISNGFWISALQESRAVSFYIFDKLKAQNYLKGLSLFENFAFPLNPALKHEIMKAKSESLVTVIELEKHKIKSLSLVINSTENAHKISENLDKTVETHWENIENILNPDSIQLELSSSGFELYYSSIC